MEKTLILFFFAIIIFSFPEILHSQNDNFGVGIIIGEPSGLSFKTFISDDNAIDAGLGWSFVDKGSLHIHADYLHHFGGIKVSSGRMPFYAGIGGRLKLENAGNKTENRIGARIPFGITYIMRDTPVDFFLEIVPILDLSPSSKISFNSAIGLRYYLK